MLRVAATSLDGRVAPCFAGVQLIVEEQQGVGPGQREVVSTCGWPLAAWGHELLRRDVAVLLCSGVDRFLYGALQGYGIEVVSNVLGPLDAALEQWRRGTLRMKSVYPDAPPGGRRARRRFRGGRHG